MATLISFEEAQREVEIQGFFPDVYDFLRLDTDQEPDTVEAISEAAWDRIEAHIGPRYIRRPITAIIRTDCAGEMIELPAMPVTIATAETFDAGTGAYTAESFIPGPTINSVILPKAAIWRLTGTAGTDPAQLPHSHVLHAWRLLVSYLFENRGDVRDDFVMNGAFSGTGARDLLRPYARV